MATSGYTVHIQSAPLDALNEDILLSLAQALEQDDRIAAPIASANLASRTLGATVSVDAGSPEAAVRAAVRAFAHATVDAHLSRVDLTEVTVEADRGLGDRHELVSGAEVARRIGVSRERVRQLAGAHGRFPPPAARVGGYRVWRWGDITDWTRVNMRPTKRARKLRAR